MATVSSKLDDLLAALPESEARGDIAIAVTGLSYSTEDAAAGHLFFCVPGSSRDGHDFAPRAVAAGAAAVLVERWLELPATVVQVRVPSVRGAMGAIAASFYGRPAERLLVVGVTGTNGKTTTTYLIEGIYRAAGLVPGVIGTTGTRVDGEAHPLARTTPEAPDLQELLAAMLDKGVRAVAMEVSSHGLDQGRVDGTRFSCAVFTNLSQDHLDYHGTMQEYLRAKARLFTPEMTRTAAVNADSAQGLELLGSGVPTITFGIHADADVRATNVSVSSDGVSFVVDRRTFVSALRGEFNVYNCLAALAAARQVGIGDEIAAEGMASVPGVPGRMEPVDRGQPFQVLIDYAHTPSSVESVLSEARRLTRGRVIAVVGCGGDRDRGKRPLMGQAATTRADLTVITSDNPRTEDPGAIIEEILPGARRGDGELVVEVDRRSAIRLALSEARPGDVVVIAGKGHETGQELAGRTIPFDDRLVAAEELEGLA